MTTAKGTGKHDREIAIMHEIMIGTADHVDWLRNNVGTAVYGAARVQYGAGGKGASDLLGVHRRTGRFIACEVKVPGESPRPDQDLFLRRIQASGGLAFCAHSVAEARLALGLVTP
jgi:hypothetical protein